MQVAKFTNTNYLPILNAVLLTDILVIILLLTGFITSNVLKKWYRNYNLSAVIADVLIIVIGIIAARWVYSHFFTSFSLWKFVIVAVMIQIIHDLSFYWIVTHIPRGKSAIIDIFKNYGRESGFKSVLADSGMMIMSCLLAYYFSSLSLNTNIILLIIYVYLVPYLIYSV